MLSTGILGALGFVFWIICSRLFDPQEIGLATSFISAAALISGLSLLGLNNSLIRFLPTSDRKNLHLSTALLVTTITNIFASGVFILWAIYRDNPIISSGSTVVWALIFAVYLLLNTLNSLLESTFIAYRAAKYITLKNIVFSVIKVLMPFLLISLGSFAIIGSISIALIASIIMGFTWLYTKFNFQPIFEIDSNVIREIYKFAAGNYAGNLFGILPSTLVPLIILSRLGASEAAFFYMPLMLITFLNIIPSASAQSFFAEISHNESELINHLRSSIQHLLLIMLPTAIVMILLSSFILNFFGPLYAQEGVTALRTLVVASMIGSLNYFGHTLLNIHKRMHAYVAMHALNAMIIITLAYIYAPRGLNAVATANLIGQTVTLSVYILINWKLINVQIFNPLKNQKKLLEA